MARSFDPDRLLHQPLMVMLGTRCAAGPRIAPMWFLWEDGALWMPSDHGASSVARLQHDRMVAAEIVDFDAQAGVLLHLGLRGRAEVGAMEQDRFRRLLAKYLGPRSGDWNPWFIENVARIEDPDGCFIRLIPDSVFTNNASFFRTGPKVLTP
ncbi:MAG: pyridoxamine 5'-phosphate oxidase [Pseudomonadota bacterium]